jgi:hypothetical protein
VHIKIKDKTHKPVRPFVRPSVSESKEITVVTTPIKISDTKDEKKTITQFSGDFYYCNIYGIIGDFHYCNIYGIIGDIHYCNIYGIIGDFHYCNVYGIIP